MNKAYHDKVKPGIVRFTGFDDMTGVFAGSISDEIIKRWNSHEELLSLAKECRVLLFNGVKQDLVKKLTKAIEKADQEPKA